MAPTTLSEPVRGQIAELLAKNKVVLFMKGNRRMPQCGFSAQVVKILDDLVPAYETVDVLQSPELREGIKQFSQWPTIPQLYIGGQFVGGCDIVREMHSSGELQKLLGADLSSPTNTETPALPTITMTEAAAKAFQAAAPQSSGGRSDPLHLQIDRTFQHELFFGPREPGDIEVKTDSLPLLLDPASARLAHGVHIDFVDGPGGADGAFKIHNPSEPPRVKSLTPKDLKSLFDHGEKLELFDVRTAQERAIAKLERARCLDGEGERYLLSLDRSTPIAFHCHHGMRSRTAAERAVQEGFKNVYNLEGGIDAWSQTVDPTVPRY
jgi:monothiol glutaredoxin